MDPLCVYPFEDVTECSTLLSPFIADAAGVRRREASIESAGAASAPPRSRQRPKAHAMSQSFTYTGTSDYIAAPDSSDGQLRHRAQRPLLVKGEPGTGKTVLANIADGLGMPMLTWHIKSTTKAPTASTSTTPCSA